MVRHFRWLAQIPGLPHLFDTTLLLWICLVHRSRLTAMEVLEFEMLRMRGIQLKVHRFGGVEFVEQKGGRELGHLHGNGLLDVLVGRKKGDGMIAARKVRPHHVFPKSSWISFQIGSIADVPFALELLTIARARNQKSKDSQQPVSLNS